MWLILTGYLWHPHRAIGSTLLSPLCRALRQAGTSPPQEAKTLDGKAILRIAFGPAAPQAAVSTLGGLYYMDPFVEGVQPSKQPFYK